MIRVAVIASLLMLSASACTEEVAAPRGTDEPFSMYGILNPLRSSQTLLVSPIEPLLYDYPETIDAAVTSTDLATGETTTWADSVVVGPLGQIDHVFWTPWRPSFGGRYRVDVARSDGASSVVEVRIPERVNVDVERGPGRSVMVHVSGEAFRLYDTYVIYHVRWAPRPELHSPCTYPAFSYVVSDGVKIEEGHDGYRVRIDIERDYYRISSKYVRDMHAEIGRNPNVGRLGLMNLTIRALVADPEWVPAEGDLERTDLAHPGTASNVTNGFGFVGAGYETSRRLFPGSDVVEASPFDDFLMRPPSDCFEYCSCAPG